MATLVVDLDNPVLMANRDYEVTVGGRVDNGIAMRPIREVERMPPVTEYSPEIWLALSAGMRAIVLMREGDATLSGNPGRTPAHSP
jgi:hypothetical protein